MVYESVLYGLVIDIGEDHHCVNYSQCCYVTDITGEWSADTAAW